MKKTLIIILIILLCYLAFVSIFTNRKTICEPMIDLSQKINQYVTWRNNETKKEYVPIKYSQILAGANGGLDWSLISTLFQKLSSTPYKDLVGQEEIKQAVQAVSGSSPTFFQFSQEPIFLIEASQAIKLTHNKTITVIPIETPTKNTILLPQESTFIPNETKLEHNNSISNKIINLNKVLVLDSDNTTRPIANYMDYLECNLVRIHEHNIDSELIPIYILADKSFSSNTNINVSIY